jgi:hypothetical protein
MELNQANADAAVAELAQDRKKLAATRALRSFGKRRSVRPLRTVRDSIGEDRPRRGFPPWTVNGA